MSDSELTLAGLFAGIGGIEHGFEKAGFKAVFANEFDPYAAQTYAENHNHELAIEDITNLASEVVPAGLTVLAGGFPCQPFSVAGYRRGFEDERGNVYWQISRLVRDRNPQVVFLENVRNLLGHDGGRTFKTIEADLIEAGYFVTHKVLNSKTHGNIPQNRERIYILAFKSKRAFSKFEWPGEIPLTAKLSDFIDFTSKLDDRYYYTESTPFFDELAESVTKQNTVYQWRRHYVRENKSGDCPTLTANMGMGGHNVPIVLTKYGIRKLTPLECFNLMGYPEIKLPTTLAPSRLYKQAGNSVVVPVVERIAEQIRLALETT